MTREAEHRRIARPLAAWMNANQLFHEITQEYLAHVRPVNLTRWQRIRGVQPRVITPAIAKMMASNDRRRHEAADDRDYYARETTMMALVAIDATLARIERLLGEGRGLEEGGDGRGGLRDPERDVGNALPEE